MKRTMVTSPRSYPAYDASPALLTDLSFVPGWSATHYVRTVLKPASRARHFWMGLLMLWMMLAGTQTKVQATPSAVETGYTWIGGSSSGSPAVTATPDSQAATDSGC